MSSYFGALMRSSGMAFDSRAPATAHVEPRVVEIDIERGPAAMSSRIVQTASTPQQAVAPIPGANSVEQLPPPVGLAADTDAHEVQAGFAGTEPEHPRAATDAAAHSPAAPEARAVETSQPALGQALVRAAMQWVAADTRQVPSVAPVVPPRGQSLPALGEEPSIIATTQALRARGADVQAQPPRATTPAAFAAQARPIGATRPTPATPPVPVAPSARDEVVEVSIGAIHVRVDAPAAQTVARPAAPPAVPRAAPAPPPRSALSRRALRRI